VQSRQALKAGEGGTPGQPKPQRRERMPFGGRWAAVRFLFFRHLHKVKRLVLAALAVEEEYGHVFLFYPVFMAAGSAWWFSQTTDLSTIRLVAWMVLLCAIVWSTRYAGAFLRYPIRFGVFFVIGMSSAAVQTARTTTVILDSPVTTVITGRVREAEAMGPDQWRYVVDILKVESPRLRRPPTSAMLTVRSHQEGFMPGTIIEGRAHLQPPAGPALPGLNDFAFASYFRGIGAIGFVFGKPKKVSDQTATDAGLLAKAATWISVLRSAISRRILTVLPGDTGAFAAAIVTNDRRALSKGTLDALRASGLAHVIAISGLHMALASGLFFFGLRYAFSLSSGFIQRWPTKKLAAIGALLAGGAYYLISGGPVSAERAYIMLLIMLGAVLVDRPVFSLRNVAFAAFIVLLVAPSSVMGPSFQMSFAAAAALISGYSLWRLKPPEMRRAILFPGLGYIAPVARLAAGILLTSAIGGLSTAVFAAAHFQRLASFGLIANLLAMPIISFIVMPFGLFGVLLMPFGLDYVPLTIMGQGLQLTIAIAKTVSGWGGSLSTGQFSNWVLPAASAAFVVMVLPKSRLRFLGALAFGIVLCLAWAYGQPQKPDLVISEDGSQLAFLKDGLLAPNRKRPASFIFDQWQRALNAPDVEPPLMKKAVLARRGFAVPLSDADLWKTEDAMEATAKKIAPERFACSGRNWCLGKLKNGMVVIAYRDPAFRGPACRQADIAVAATRLPVSSCQKYEALQIDQALLRKRGALAVYTVKGGRKIILRGAMDGAARPWNRHRYYDWRSGRYAKPYMPISDSAGSGR
jgi:competence protein ComEC